ncbi:MAG: LemA family protein [Bacteroidales bacterium]|nr:LemA family protein [Bacteroidales bacterium]MDE6236895.1 LemA family protein [Muribaculaceae bacterium]MDE6836320.1 LemA family protein [Muribaculaceae bacterium]
MTLLKKIFFAVIAMVMTSGLSSCNYNSLVEKQQNVDQAWAQVENQYQRRADLIPNLVNTVKGYAAHESSTLESVTRARAGLTQAYDAAKATEATPDNIEQYQQAQSKLKGALDIYVNAVKEAYPDLKANTNFLDLQTQLEGTENRISTERMRYTEVVKDYNTAIKKFPTTIYAGWFGFKEKPQFKAEAGAQKAPTVEF